ncbi:MAG: sugar ABC transporter permease [Bacilli bacterium]|jgi:ABC-type sugar transport system permease subunit|nr:sugar ABC transporter permease [Bacilli bacterium]
MTKLAAPVIEAKAAPAPKKRKAHKGNWKTYLFVFLMLLYPLAQFCLMWFGVNINSIFLTFKSIDPATNVLTWNLSIPYLWEQEGDAFGVFFYNYKTLFLSLTTKTVSDMFLASFAYLVISCFVTLPIALFMSYFIFKKIIGASFYKTIFFIPSIFPLFILCLVFSLSLSSSGGIIPGILSKMGLDYGDFFNNIFLGENVGDSASWAVWVFFLWSGLGYDIILLTAGMSRIPRDILESCRMDGVSPMKEFFRIIVPLTWPTITTLFIFGMMAIFSTTFQPFFLTSGRYATMTIGLQIYQSSQGTALQTPATLGLFCSLVAAPVIIATRNGLNRCFKNVGF